jgi:hypothetical protein
MISPKHLPQISKRDVEVMVATLLHLRPFFHYLCFISSTFLCCLLLQELHDCHRLASLSLSLFFLFPYFPLVQLVLLYSCLIVITKSAQAPSVYNIGTSTKGSRTTLLWVRSFMGNNTHEV